MLINNLELILCIGQVEYAAVLQGLHLLWVHAAAVGKEGAAAGTQIGQVQDAVGLAQRAMMTADAVFIGIQADAAVIVTTDDDAVGTDAVGLTSQRTCDAGHFPAAT